MDVGVCGGKDFWKGYVFSLEWKSEGVMDDDSGDNEEDEGEEDWLRQGWRSETGSLFQRWSDACRKERFVIFDEELAGGRARVTTEEVRVQRGGWREIRLMGYTGLRGCENLVCTRE